ncbi:hypothetical protein GCM10027515_24580 [Schumannella luteola]
MVVAGGTLAVLLVAEPFLPGGGASTTPVHRVATGDDLEQQGTSFRISKAGIFTAESASPVTVPKGYALVGVLVSITPGDDAPADPGSCDIVLAAPGGPGDVDRAWTSESSPSQYDYGTSRGTRSLCRFSDDGERLTYEGVFLVPEAVYDDAWLEIRFTGSKAQSYARSVYRLALPDDPIR